MSCCPPCCSMNVLFSLQIIQNSFYIISDCQLCVPLAHSHQFSWAQLRHFIFLGAISDSSRLGQCFSASSTSVRALYSLALLKSSISANPSVSSRLSTVKFVLEYITIKLSSKRTVLEGGKGWGACQTKSPVQWPLPSSDHDLVLATFLMVPC